MADEDFEFFDLFGQPDTGSRRGRGRPRRKATEKDRRIVKDLLADGKTITIAAAIVGMSEPTFRREFFSEIKDRHLHLSRLNAEMIEVLREEALVKRNMGAMRQLREVMARMAVTEAEALVSRVDSKAEPAGKKEVRAALARDADSDLMAELELEAKVSARH